MTERFANMSKVPNQPAARMLASANAKLGTPTEAPASAPAKALLEELAAKEAWVDIARLMGVILPPRERVWWACMAGRDFTGMKPGGKPPQCLSTAEDWVRRPSPENRDKLADALDIADPDDETAKCAMCALYADGTLGTGDLAEQPAPPGGSEIMAFAANMVALQAHEGDPNVYLQVLIDRAVDIARGGNGRIEPEARQQED